MADVYSKQLFGAKGFTSTTVPNGYIPPSGYTAVIRCVTVYIGASFSGELSISDLFTGALIWRANPPLVSGAYYQVEADVRIVVPAGFTVSVDAGDTWDVTVSGYELYLP
jgi:hypothetical protein